MCIRDRHVLVLRKNESVAWQAAVGVMKTAGIGEDVVLPLLKIVNERGQGIVAQGREEDMQMLAGLFAEIGMTTSIQEGSAPQAKSHT